MATYENFTTILRKSKEFTFEGGSILVLRDYYTGDEIRLDLSKVTPEMFSEIQVRPPKHEIWERCKEEIKRWESRTDDALDKIDEMRCPLEYADNTLYNDIERVIEDYCWDNDIDQDDRDGGPEEILCYTGEEDE